MLLVKHPFINVCNNMPTFQFQVDDFDTFLPDKKLTSSKYTHQKLILLEHQIIMTWNTSGQSNMQSVCHKWYQLLRELSYCFKKKTETNSRIQCKIPDMLDDFTVEWFVCYKSLYCIRFTRSVHKSRKRTHFSWAKSQVTNKSSQKNGAKLFSELDTEAWSDWKASSRLQLPIGSEANPKSPKCTFKGKRCNLTPRIWLGPATLNVSTVNSLMSTAPLGT